MRKLIAIGVGPGGCYDLYIDDEKPIEGVPSRVWVLNDTGKGLRDRLVARMGAKGK